MACEMDKLKVAAYLDGALNEQDAALVQEHIASCGECAAEVAETVALKRGMVAARKKFVASDALRAKVMKSVAPRRARWYGLAWWMTAGTFALIALLVVVVMVRQRSGGDEMAEMVDLHLNTLASANPYDVVSSDRHTVKPWFQGRIPFAFNVPEFAGTDFTLLGGKMVYVERRPRAQLIVGHGQHRISVLILQAERGDAATDGAVSRETFNVEAWKSAGLSFAVVGDVEAPTLERLGGMFRQANP